MQADISMYLPHSSSSGAQKNIFSMLKKIHLNNFINKCFLTCKSGALLRSNLSSACPNNDDKNVPLSIKFRFG